MGKATNTRIRVGVSPYVYKYIWKQYGPGDRFEVSASRNNTLRLALTFLPMAAEVIPCPERLPGRSIYLDLGTSQELRAAAQAARPFIRAGYFFQHEFNQAILTYIEAQRDLARRQGLKETEWNARLALEQFLDRYEIEEHEYSYDSLRRQYNRVNHDQARFFSEKLSMIFEFCPCGKSGLSDADIQRAQQSFTPCRVYFGLQPRIVFRAFSRRRGKIHPYELRIPRKLLDLDEHWPWIKANVGIINHHLRQGVTCR